MRRDAAQNTVDASGISMICLYSMGLNAVASVREYRVRFDAADPAVSLAEEVDFNDSVRIRVWGTLRRGRIGY